MADRAATFTFTSDDPEASFECSLNGAAFASCASPIDYRLHRGVLTFAVRAVDAAGNRDPTPATRTWTIQ